MRLFHLPNFLPPTLAKNFACPYNKSYAYAANFMDEKTLQLIRDKLLAEKTRIEKELAGFTQKDTQVAGNYRSDFPQFGEDEESNAMEVADFDSRLGIEHTLESALRDVNKALELIDTGEYGICKYCKQPIEEQRLLVRPMSSSCVACKKKLQGEQ